VGTAKIISMFRHGFQPAEKSHLLIGYNKFIGVNLEFMIAKEGKWGGIFRFSDPAAEKRMTDLLASRIQDWQVDIFRMDRNTNPLPFRRDADTPDRQGLTEIRQIEGLYAM
jgi:hypothetical protein